VKASILDASAVLALLQAEPGYEQVEASLPDSAISAVNLAEVIGKLHESGMPEEAIRSAVGALGLEVAPFTEQNGYDTGFLYAGTRHQGLSLGDRACLALGRRRNHPVITADRTWQGLDIGVDVRIIR